MQATTMPLATKSYKWDKTMIGLEVYLNIVLCVKASKVGFFVSIDGMIQI